MHENISITYEDFAELARSASNVTYQDDPHRIHGGIKRIKADLYETAQKRALEPAEKEILDMCVGMLLWTPEFVRLAIEES